MLSSVTIDYFEKLLSEKIITTRPLSGGDINATYVLQTNHRKVVVKTNSASKFPGMFEAEAVGLKTLKESNTFVIPKVLNVGVFNAIAFLVLEYIDTTKPIENFWEIFGRQLATLHQNSQDQFGFDTDNYIGSLPQCNKMKDSSAEFYITRRLEPQLMWASKNGFSFSGLDIFYKNIAAQIPNEPSSLVHGDLWSGNFMIDKHGMPCLIDPAVAYASREMDIAMMHLFGGFDPKLFGAYQEVFPLQDNWKDRLSVFQLYYLLVHLNLFGSSYYPEVKNIIEKYS